MAAPVVKGFDGFTEQSSQKRTVQGETKRVRIWLGPASKLDAFLQGVLDLEPPPESVVSEDGVPAKIEAVFPIASMVPGGDPAVEAEDASVWELIGQDLEKPLATHGFYNISDSAYVAIEAADEAIRKGTARKTDWDVIYATWNIQSYVNHQLRGIDTWNTSSYIVRKSMVFNSAVPIKLEFSVAPGSPARPGTVITWADLDTLIPESAKFERPLVHLYDSNFLAFIDKPLNEWLVKAPSLKWEKGKKIWELTREYWGAEKWSQDLYDGGSYVP